MPQPWISCKQMVEKTAKIAFRFELENRSKDRPNILKHLFKFAKKSYRNAVPLQRKRNSAENTWNHPNLTKNNRFGGPKGIPFGENFVTISWLFGSLSRFGCALDKKSAGERFPCRFLVDFWLILDRCLIDFWWISAWMSLNFVRLFLDFVSVSWELRISSMISNSD